MLNNQLNFKFCESQRIFRSAWQQSPQQFQKILTPELLKRIYTQLTGKAYPYIIDANNLNIDFFSKIISICYLPTISSFEDLALFQGQVNSSFANLPERQARSLNRNMFCPNLTQECYENYLEQLKYLKEFFERESENDDEIDIRKTSEWLVSIYMLDKEAFLNCLLGFKRAMNHLFFGKLDVNKVSPFHEDFFKCLLFICEAGLCFPQVSNEIGKVRYFESNEFKAIYQDSFVKVITNGDYSCSALLGFTNACLLLEQEFAQYFSFLLVKHEAIKNIKANLPKLANEALFLQQFLHIFTEVLKMSFSKKLAIFSEEHIYDLQQLAISVLTQLPSLQTTAMGLINEIVKYNLPAKFGQDLRIAFKPLQFGGELLTHALLIWQTALSHGNKLFTDTVFIEREKYISVLQALLAQTFKEKAQSLHVQCLEIIYLMIAPQFHTCFDRLLNCLTIVLQASSVLYTFVSQILKKMCLSLHLEQFVLGESILALSGHLMKESVKTQNAKRTQGRVFFINSIILANALQCLYILFSNKKISKKVCPNNMIEMYNLMMDIVRSANKSILNEVLKNIKMIRQDIKLRLYGLIFFACENILALISNSDKEILKQLAASRQTLLAHLYELLTPLELQQENIPIMVDYHFSLDVRRTIQFKRFLPLNLPYIAFKTYLLAIVQANAIKEDFKQIFAIKFRDIKNRNLEIKGESEYKGMIDRIRKGSSEYVYWLKIQEDMPPMDMNALLLLQRPVNSYTSMNTLYNNKNSPLRTRNATQISRSQRPSQRTSSPYQRTSSRISKKCENCGQSSPSARLCVDCNHI